MNLTESANDIVLQATNLLSPPDMSDWEPLAHLSPDEQIAAEQLEYEHRARAKIDKFLADRADRLACLKAIREAVSARIDAYENEAAPWQRMAEQQKRLRAHVEQLAHNMLVAEREAAGLDPEEGYAVELRNGTKVRLAVARAVVVEDEAALPPELYEDRTTRHPDKRAIGELLKRKQAVPGARLGINTHVKWR